MLLAVPLKSVVLCWVLNQVSVTLPYYGLADYLYFTHYKILQ